MLHARRPDGPVAAAQNCATHGPLSVGDAAEERNPALWPSQNASVVSAG